VSMDAFQRYWPATDPQTMTCFLGKFFLAGACNSSMSRRFSALMTFFGSYVSYTIIDWLMHNKTRAMKLHYDLFHFLNVICYIFCLLCHSYCRFLSFMSFVCRSLLFILSFFNRLLIIFFCHLSIVVLCPPVPIDWIVVRNHS